MLYKKFKRNNNIQTKSPSKFFPCSLLLRIVVSLLFLWKQQGQTLSNGLY